MATINQLKVSDMCTGRGFTAEVTKETKCYYFFEIKGYYTNGNSNVGKVHKSTMCIDWQHLLFRTIES